MSIPMNERRDDIIYFLLDKVKHNGEEAKEVSYTQEDFGDKVVEKEQVKQHLQFAIDSDYLEGELADADNQSVLAVCKNAKLTTEGRNVLRKDFFKV